VAIESYPQEDVPAALLAQTMALRDQAWPGEPGEPGERRELHDPALSPVLVVLVEENVLLASLAILSKTIEHGGESFRASGLSAVVTGQRQHGYGHRLVTAAKDMLAADGTDVGIFTCDRPLARFYERAGWKVLPGTALVGGTPADPLCSDDFDKVTLAAFFTAHARRHAQAFEQARIHLYPGNRDRLW
jgi:aminoglycoside 2'-N-acetyltransferase I